MIQKFWTSYGNPPITLQRILQAAQPILNKVYREKYQPSFVKPIDVI
jgi:hypothetical protein